MAKARRRDDCWNVLVQGCQGFVEWMITRSVISNSKWMMMFDGRVLWKKDGAEV